MWQAVLVFVLGWLVVAASAFGAARLVASISERAFAAAADAALRVRFGDGEVVQTMPGVDGDVTSVAAVGDVPDWTDALLVGPLPDFGDPGWSLPGDGPDMAGEDL
jgi:hypothetical protein